MPPAPGRSGSMRSRIKTAIKKIDNILPAPARGLLRVSSTLSNMVAQLFLTALNILAKSFGLTITELMVSVWFAPLDRVHEEVKWTVRGC